jgi:hypothetical protein
MSGKNQRKEEMGEDCMGRGLQCFVCVCVWGGGLSRGGGGGV